MQSTRMSGLLNAQPATFPTRNLGYWLFILLFLPSCYSDRPVDEIAVRFGQQYPEIFSPDLPEIATLARLSGRLDSLQVYRQLLATIDTHTLSEKGKTNRKLLQGQLQQEWDHWSPYQNNPALYNFGGLLKQQLVQKDDELRERFQKLSGLMDQAHTYYGQARDNLLVGDISLYRLAAQKQYLGLEFLQGELQDSLAVAGLPPEEKQLIGQKIETTYQALKDYLAFCESVYINHRDSTHYAVGR